MKKVALVLLTLILPSLAAAQLKEQTQPIPFSRLLTSSLTQPQGLVSLFGLNPSRFSMQQSFALSYTTFGGHGYSQGVYLNTMGYRVADNMNVSLQWGLMNQPLGSFGVPGMYNNGFFVSGASFDYKPSRNIAFSVQYSTMPYRYYSPYRYSGGYYDNWWEPSPSSAPSQDK
ncbi:hypothetical protein KJ068_02370 [bacterium]|nr:hypothetical protein [bacterium]